MIELTPLDVRKKKGDFTRGLRGYDPREVDQFLGLVAERLEEVVKVNLSLRERVEELAARVEGQEGRERAVQDALVTAQSLKLDIQEQAKREAERIRRETAEDSDRIRQHSEREAERVRHSAEKNARELEEKAERTLEAAQASVEKMIADREQELAEFARRRSRFLESFRMLLEREIEVVQLAEASKPDDGIDLDVVQFGQGAPVSEVSPDPDDEIVVPDEAAEVKASGETEGAADGDAATPEAAEPAAAVGGDKPASAPAGGSSVASDERSGRASNGAAVRARRETVTSREAKDGGPREERWGAG